MTQGLERRLNAVEARRFGSARVAKVLRVLDSMSDLELAEQLAGPSGVLAPRNHDRWGAGMLRGRARPAHFDRFASGRTRPILPVQLFASITPN
jgi:hypothetical protein